MSDDYLVKRYINAVKSGKDKFEFSALEWAGYYAHYFPNDSVAVCRKDALNFEVPNTLVPEIIIHLRAKGGKYV